MFVGVVALCYQHNRVSQLPHGQGLLTKPKYNAKLIYYYNYFSLNNLIVSSATVLEIKTYFPYTKKGTLSKQVITCTRSYLSDCNVEDLHFVNYLDLNYITFR